MEIIDIKDNIVSEQIKASIDEMVNAYCDELIKQDKEIKRLNNRINKAIEYIEEHKEPLHHWFDEPDCDYWLATNPDDILDILKGNDSNE